MLLDFRLVMAFNLVRRRLYPVGKTSFPRSAISSQSCLRLPRGTSTKEARRTTSYLLEAFGLIHIADSFVGGPHENARG